MSDPISGSLVYQLLKDSYNLAKRFRETRHRDRAQTKILLAQTALQNPHLYEYLQWKYAAEPILNRCGKFYPVAIYPAPEALYMKPDAVLLNLDPYIKTDKLKTKNETFRKITQAAGRPLKDRFTFTMKEICIEPTFGLYCQLGKYFQALDTCDSLEWELLSNSHKLRGSAASYYTRFEKYLPLRTKLHSLDTQPLRSGQHRSAAIGICTLVAFNYRDSICLWVKKRSPTGVAVYAGYYDTVPSFMFQPATSYLDDEFSVTHNIYREYLEEIFDRPEPEEKEDDSHYFYGDMRLTFLLELIKRNKAQVFLTGIAVDLLNLRPEICTLLLIRTPDWHEFHSSNPEHGQRFHLNIEYETLNALSFSSSEPGIARVHFAQTDDEMNEVKQFSNTKIVPSGAAAFWLGVDVLRKVL
ncbi:MAG: hypothetical protein ABSB78_09500 [Bacteroidota bacterium]